MSSGWIGVDLDGTLAHYDGWKGELKIGAPVPLMLTRVKNWIADGKTVKIFTARVYEGEGRQKADVAEITKAIQDWCEACGLPRLEVTNVKDFGMIELWDDRAVTVQMNTGIAKATRS